MATTPATNAPPVEPLPRRGQLGFALALAALFAFAVWAALELEILVDDAFITFRYVSNARDGHGLVWNPPPFLPVEGYTSLSWALALWATWSWFGIEPPHAANWLSIACGLLTLALVARVAVGLRDRSGARIPVAAAFATVALVGTNRTFLQWMTSGLETAAWNLVFVGWVVLAFRGAPRRTTCWLALWSALAALAATTRPDGVLLVAATAGVAVLGWLRGERALGATLGGLAPSTVVAAHFVWRRAFYGEWLPNTYYAKVSDPWPEAGVRYLLAFGLEHGVWLWLPLALGALALLARRLGRGVVHALADGLPACAAVAVVLAHAAYYVVVVGGDHFEYRVLSHLVPLGALATAAAVARLRGGGVLPFAAAVASGIAGSFGWLHLALTEPLHPPRYDMLAPKVPRWLEPVARWHDRQRIWLLLHTVCFRFRNDLTLDGVLRLVPERRRVPFDLHDVPVARITAAGLVGWVLPDVALIDALGLNDWVAARTPTRTGWSMSFLPREVLVATLAAADADGDGWLARGDLATAFGAIPGATPEHGAAFAEMLLVLFADRRRDAMSRAESEEIVRFFGELRLMAHEHLAPDDYVAALDPNVTIDGPVVHVRKREKPLSADGVRAIEAAWRARIRGGGR